MVQGRGAAQEKKVGNSGGVSGMGAGCGTYSIPAIGPCPHLEGLAEGALTLLAASSSWSWKSEWVHLASH